MALNILDIVESRCQWVVDINDNNLPVCFFFVEQCHDTKYFDLLDFTPGSNKLANLADIKGVVVTLGFGLWMDCVGVFPGLPIDCQLQTWPV